MKRLQGKVAIITGASKGLGVHIAAALAREGVQLVLAARSERALAETCRAAESHGVHAIAVPVDLAAREAVEQLVARAEQAFGRVDLLVNNAGIMHVEDYAVLDPDSIEQTIQLNLRAPMLLARRVLPGMIARGEGHIVNISSVAGLGGGAYTESYSATKHALMGFTRSLRLTLEAEGHPIGASVVCPGIVPDLGMFHENMRASGAIRPARFGVAPAEAVARAVVRAIQRDQPEVVVNSLPVRPLVMLLTMFPSLAGRIARATGLGEVCRDIAHGQPGYSQTSVAPRTSSDDSRARQSEMTRDESLRVS